MNRTIPKGETILDRRGFRPVGVGRGGATALLLVLIALNCGVELVLLLADAGWIGAPRWRGLAYENGAFWAGLLDNWRPNFAAQPWTMFLTYAFLHGDIWHLLGNMITLFFLAEIVVARTGRAGFLALYLLSAVGGAAMFGLLSGSPQPMVGASGALFGLAGAWLYQEWADRGIRGRSRWPVVQMILGLVVLNAVLWVALAGLLAWETHLGGFITGWICAFGLARLGRRRGGG